MNRTFTWPEGRSCALSLTYDDALPIHYEYVGPALKARGLLGTFFLFIGGDPIVNHQRWKEMAAQGHEMGNHTLFHPCRREPPEIFHWLDEGFDLRDYTPYRFQLELRVANFVLHLLDGKQLHTYGNTCSDIYIGQGDKKISIDDLLQQDFVAARGVMSNRMVTVTESLNLMNVGHCIADGRSFEELRDEICEARKASAWIVYMIHGVGAETKELYIEKEVHERLLDYLAETKDVWVAPFITIASWIREWQEGK